MMTVLACCVIKTANSGSFEFSSFSCQVFFFIMVLSAMIISTWSDNHFITLKLIEKCVCSVESGRKSLVSFTVTKVHWMNEIGLDWNEKWSRRVEPFCSVELPLPVLCTQKFYHTWRDQVSLSHLLCFILTDLHFYRAARLNLHSNSLLVVFGKIF